MDAEVSLREFRSEVEAEVAAAALRANGIPAETRPGYTNLSTIPTTLAGPTVVCVSAEDVERATEILDTPADDTSGEQ